MVRERSGEMTKWLRSWVKIEETGDFIVNEKEKKPSILQRMGCIRWRNSSGLKTWQTPENLEIQHNIILALRAHNLMARDKIMWLRTMKFLLWMSLQDVLCLEDVIPMGFSGY